MGAKVALSKLFNPMCCQRVVRPLAVLANSFQAREAALRKASPAEDQIRGADSRPEHECSSPGRSISVNLITGPHHTVSPWRETGVPHTPPSPESTNACCRTGARRRAGGEVERAPCQIFPGIKAYGERVLYGLCADSGDRSCSSRASPRPRRAIGCLEACIAHRMHACVRRAMRATATGRHIFFFPQPQATGSGRSSMQQGIRSK
jgi:hypothetical protein